MSDEHKTTAELEAHVNGVAEQCIEAIKGFDNKLDSINKKYDDRITKVDKRLDNQSDEINRELPKQIKDLLHMVDKIAHTQKGHEDELKESRDNKKFFGRTAITAIITLVTAAIVAWWNAGFGGK